MKVIKRDGRHADYERNKIFIAMKVWTAMTGLMMIRSLTLLHQSKHAAMK